MANTGVKGRVVFAGTTDGIKGVQVCVVDIDPISSEDVLGTTLTDANGDFSIEYDTSDYRIWGADGESPDIRVRIYGDGWRILWETPKQDNVDAAILRVQVNFLGELNFERRQLKFDASLFDSKLLGFPLSGDMALRLDWSADANFLLTVGGFHPAYQPPPMELPAIRRQTLALLEGDNPRLRLEMYFAVTSNTAQFGAKLELYAAAWKFNVYNFLTFNVLFQFNPFYFIAEITAMLALRMDSSSFASIKLTLTLEEPTPWKAQGTAKFNICWFFTLKVRFNKTFGEARNTTLPDVAVLPLLVAALEANDNWEAELPEQRHRLESICEAPGELLVHPVGTLKVSQKVVPLNVRIDRIGSQRPSDGREFRIENVQPTANLLEVQESFAPAQFFDLTDESDFLSLPLEFYGYDRTTEEAFLITTGGHSPAGYNLAEFDAGSVMYAPLKDATMKEEDFPVVAYIGDDRVLAEKTKGHSGPRCCNRNDVASDNSLRAYINAAQHPALDAEYPG